MSARQALVTGASSDIGRAIVGALVADGVLVTAAGRDAARLADLPATAIVGDLMDAAYIERLAEVPADIFVAAAGHRFVYQRFVAFDPEDARRLQAVDVDAFAVLCKRLIPGMMGRRFGRIVAVTSLAAMVGGPGAAPYAQAKAAVEGLVRGLATDVGRFGITVNAVAPGFVQTSRLAARSGDATRDLAKKTAVGRLASPEDVAGPVAFLCGSAAAYVTGHTLIVDGGLHLATAW